MTMGIWGSQVCSSLTIDSIVNIYIFLFQEQVEEKEESKQWEPWKEVPPPWNVGDYSVLDIQCEGLNWVL